MTDTKGSEYQEKLAKEQLRKLELENADLQASLSLKEAQIERERTQNTTEKVKADAIETQAKVAKKKLSLAFWTSILKGVWKFLAIIGNFLKIFLRDLSPYLALIAIIVLIIVLLGTKKKSSKPKNSKNKNGTSTSKSKSGGFFTPGYKIRSMFNYFNGNVRSIKRPVEKYGRCDNMEWQHTGGNAAGICVRTVAPKDIEWNAGPDKIPELAKLPKIIKDSITKDSQRSTIYIPWAEQGPFYVPQCSKAYFKVYDKDGKETKESADYLFKDNGLTCERIVKESSKYGISYRPRDSRGNLMNFASEDDPKCTN